jgi:hypothetical protein
MICLQREKQILPRSINPQPAAAFRIPPAVASIHVSRPVDLPQPRSPVANSENPVDGGAIKRRSPTRALGLGLISGAADDDPSAIGIYANAGAKLGASFLWTAPVTLPTMFAVVYLSAKLGEVCFTMDLPHHRDRHSKPADSQLAYVDPKHIPRQQPSEGDHRSEVYAKDSRTWSGPYPRLRRRAMPPRSASQMHGATSVPLRSREYDFRAIGHSPEVARVPRHAELTCVPPVRGCVRPRQYDRRRRGSAACATRRTGHWLTRFLHPA